jgi:hypothetical protein
MSSNLTKISINAENETSKQSPKPSQQISSNEKIIKVKYYRPISSSTPESPQSESSMPLIMAEAHYSSPSSGSHSSSQSPIRSITISSNCLTKSRRNRFNKLNKEKILEIKREKNREAAAKCRKKKLEMINEFENYRNKLINENCLLETEVIAMRAQNLAIKQLLLQHRIEGVCKLGSK